jgi:hypothetical protein
MVKNDPRKNKNSIVKERIFNGKSYTHMQTVSNKKDANYYAEKTRKNYNQNVVVIKSKDGYDLYHRKRSN